MSDYGYRKVGAASIPVTVGNPAENAKQVLAAMQKAQVVGAQAFVLPELCLSGYTCGDLFRQSALLDACEAALLWLLEQTEDYAAVAAVGLPVRVRGKLYNCAAVMQSGRLLGFVPKQRLSGEESRWFAAYQGEWETVTLFGREAAFGRALFQSKDKLTIGIEVGSDCDVPVPPAAELALQGAEIILNLAAFGEGAGGQAYRRTMLAQQSARLLCGYVMACAGAGESTTDLTFSGACMIAEQGQILAESPRFVQEGASVYASVDAELLRARRRGDAAWSAEDSSLPVTACGALPPLDEAKINRRFDAKPFVPEDPALRYERCREVLEMQTAGLIKRMKHTGTNRLIIGISGGLDSALALLVALRACKALALDARYVLGVTMPGFGTSFYTRQTVDDLAESLGFTLREIDIRPACELHMKDIGHDPQVHDATYENIQARERTQILMDLANKEGALLLGTGDLSELALGWCTYNGDHMSMYGLNGGVPKTLIPHLIAHAMEMEECGEQAKTALRRVLNTPISPELLPTDDSGQITQKTENLIGSYDVQDFYLYHFFRHGFAPAKLHFMAARAFKGEHTPAQLKEWLVLFLRRFFAQQFKRSCLPDAPAVGSVSLSPRGGLRMPSDASAQLWIAMAEQIEG